MEQKIQLKHPTGKKNVRIDKGEYGIIQKAISKSIKEKGELTHTEILDCVIKELKKNRIKFKNSIGWYVESVKLDMEAGKIIERIPRTSPQRYSIIK